MKPVYARTLSTLRRERRLSQKQAAGDLGISQALLSHYENGVREPKLEFIIRACTYYNVSTDYLLGRTAVRALEGKIPLDCTTDDQRRNAGAAALLVSLLSEIGDADLSRSASAYIGFSLFTALSALRGPARPYTPLFDAAMKKAEAAFMADVHRVRTSSGLPGHSGCDGLWGRSPEELAAMLELGEWIDSAVSGLA